MSFEPCGFYNDAVNLYMLTGKRPLPHVTTWTPEVSTSSSIAFLPSFCLRSCVSSSCLYFCLLLCLLRPQAKGGDIIEV